MGALIKYAVIKVIRSAYSFKIFHDVKKEL
jgi:hypothetical protein